VGAAMAASAADRANLILQAGAMVVNNGFMLTLWFLFFAGFHSVGGWRLPDMALSMGIIMTLVGVAGVAFGGYRDMAAVILGGEIDTLLTQPQPVLARFARVRWVDAPWLAVGWFCGLTVYLSAAIGFASLAFWAAGARSLARDLTEFVILVSSYPGSIYSGAGRLIVYSLLPAGFIVLTPVALLRRPTPATLAIELAAAALYATLAGLLFAAGMRRYRRGESPV
jgi:ABC-2 type transport system permease protein